MNIRKLLLATLFAGALIPAAQAAMETLDQVVAIVDDDVILASELRERVNALTQTMQSRGVDLPPEDEIIRETLDRLILESIQLQLGLRVGDRCQRVSFPLTIDDLYAVVDECTADQFDLPR